MKCMSVLGFDKRCEKTKLLTPTYFFNPNVIEKIEVAINCQTHSNLILDQYLKEYNNIQLEIDVLNGRKSKKDAKTDYGRYVLVPEIKKRRLDELYRARKIITDFKCRNPECKINGSIAYERHDTEGKFTNERAFDDQVYIAFAIGNHGRDRAILKLHDPCWEQLKRKLGLGIIFNTTQSLALFQ